MADARLTLLETNFGLVEANETLIFDDITANEGSTTVEIAGRIAPSEIVVKEVIAIMIATSVVKEGQDFDGTKRYWTAGTWATLIKSNRAAVRAWIEANDGGLISQMVTDLTIPEPIAAALVLYINGQRWMKVTRV